MELNEPAFNRTIKELKWKSLQESTGFTATFNRTIKELKLEFNPVDKYLPNF